LFVVNVKFGKAVHINCTMEYTESGNKAEQLKSV